MMKETLLLIILLVCHYLADFCFTFPALIRAKADGKNLEPIALHSSVHAALVWLCLVVFGVEWKLLFLLVLLELVSHFIIDTSKARLSIRFTYLADMRHKPYWMLYGLDQLLHQFVVIIIWFCTIHEQNLYI